MRTLLSDIIGIYFVFKLLKLILYRHNPTVLYCMHKILIINPKGGCGKSTVSTQLAGYYANWGMSVALADMDPQKSSLNWLRKRPANTANIIAINAVQGRIQIPIKTDCVIIDTAAGLQDKDLRYLAKLCDTIIIPVLPSEMDIHAVSHFVYQLLIKYRITFEDRNICIIANRAKMRSLVYQDLINYLSTLKLPLISTLRESKYYLDCAASGLSIFDPVKPDLSNLISDWQPIFQWLHEVEMKKKFRSKSSAVAV